MEAELVAATPAARAAMVRDRQRRLYGAPVGVLVRRLTEDLGISQARLARVIGISPAALSLLASAQRTKFSDPVTHTRLMLLETRRAHGPITDPGGVEALLAQVARVQSPWPLLGSGTGGAPAEVLRGLASAEDLAAAAAVLDAGFPVLAGVLREAAGDGASVAVRRDARAPRRRRGRPSRLSRESGQ